MNMQTLLSMRHVGPFREPVQEQLTALSDTADTLELWIKVQLLWTALESVFMGMYQCPSERPKLGHDVPLIDSTVFREPHRTPTARDPELNFD